MAKGIGSLKLIDNISITNVKHTEKWTEQMRNGINNRVSPLVKSNVLFSNTSWVPVLKDLGLLGTIIPTTTIT